MAKNGVIVLSAAESKAPTTVVSIVDGTLRVDRDLTTSETYTFDAVGTEQVLEAVRGEDTAVVCLGGAEIAQRAATEMFGDGEVEVQAVLIYDEEISDLLRPGNDELWWHRGSAASLIQETLKVRAALTLENDVFWQCAHVVLELRQGTKRFRIIEVGEPFFESRLDLSYRALLASTPSTLTSHLGDLRPFWLGCVRPDLAALDDTLRILHAVAAKPTLTMTTGEVERRVVDATEERRRWFADRGIDDADGMALVLLTKNSALSRRVRIPLRPGTTTVIEARQFSARPTRLTVDSQIHVDPVDDAVRVNGVVITERRTLDVGDVLVLGYETAFVLEEGNAGTTTTWDAATALSEDGGFAIRVLEANALADALERDVTYEMKVKPRGVIVRSPRCDVDDFWDQGTFLTRLGAMRRVKRHGPNEDDPFFDPPDHHLIGIGFLFLDALSYMMDIEEAVPIVNFKGDVAGEVDVRVKPALGDDNTEEENPAFTTEEIQLQNHKGEVLSVTIDIVNARSLPRRLATSVFVRTTWFLQREALTTARRSAKAVPIHRFDDRFHVRQLITDDLLAYLRDSALELQVWGQRI